VTNEFSEFSEAKTAVTQSLTGFLHFICLVSSTDGLIRQRNFEKWPLLDRAFFRSVVKT